MSKNLHLLVALLIALVACSTLAFGESVEMKFVNDFIATDSYSILEFTFKDISATTLTGNNWISPRKNPSDTSDKTQLYQVGVWYSLNSNPATSLGYRGDMCWDPVTGQIVAQASHSGNTVSFSYSSWVTKQFADDKINSWTMRCAIGISVDPVPDVFEWEVGVNNGIIGHPTLAWPSRGIVDPVINFKAAGVKQTTEDPFSSAEVNIEFTTTQFGPHVVYLENGPRPYAVSLETGLHADFFCTAGKDKEFARILYQDDGEDSSIVVHVPTTTTEVIKCKLSYTNYYSNNWVNLDKQVIQISLGSSRVHRSLQLKTVRGGAGGYLEYESNYAYVEVFTTPLSMTAAEVHVNSTMEFVFSPEINIKTIALYENTGDETSYRTNYNCYGRSYSNNRRYFYATSYVDAAANKLTLKDVLLPEDLRDGRVYCDFEFKGSKVVTYETKPQFAWVQMTIDGSQLAALAGTEVKIPLWVQTHGDLNSLNNNDNHIETEKDGVITIVDYFRVVQDDFYIVMRDPRLIFSISGTNTLTVENYKDHLKCQITSPTVSEFKDLKLNFDDKRFVWEAELVDLKLLEGYDLTVKCTRSVNKVMLYGYDMTPTNSLEVQLIDLIGGKTHYDYYSRSMGMEARKQTPKQTGSFPTANNVQLVDYQAEFVLPINFDVKTVSEDLRKNFATWILAAKFNDNKQYWDISAVGPTYVWFETTAPNQHLPALFQPTAPAVTNSKYYQNLYSIDDYFDYMISLQKDGAIGLDYYHLSSFKNIQESNRHLSWSSAISVHVRVQLKFAQKDQSASLPSLEWKGDEGFYSAIYGQSIVPQMSSDIASTNLSYGSSVVPATGCGYTAGLNIFSSQQPKYNYGSSSDDADDKWSDLQSLFPQSIHSYFHALCTVGEACSTNADCEGSLMCSAGVCKQMDLYLPRYLDLSDTYDNPIASALERKYASNATVGSMIAVVVVAVLAMLF